MRENTGRAFVLLMVAGLGVSALIYVGVRQEPQPDTSIQESAAPTSATYDAVESASVPNGLLGLSFGMTASEARAALPELASATPLEPRRVLPDVSGPVGINAKAALEVLQTGVVESLPGSRMELETTIGGYPTTCELEFSVDDGLSRMVCEIPPLANSEQHREARSVLLDALNEKYGRAVARSDTRSVWKSRNAVFEVTAPRGAGTISLDNRSAAHVALVSKIKQRVNQRQKEELERTTQKPLTESVRDLRHDL